MNKHLLLLIMLTLHSGFLKSMETRRRQKRSADATQKLQKKQKKEEDTSTLALANFVGEIPKEFNIFCLSLQKRKEIEEKNILIPHNILLTGKKEVGKTLLIQDLATVLGAFYFLKKKEELQKELPKDQPNYYKKLLKDSLTHTKIQKKLLFFHVELGTTQISHEALKKIKEKIEKENIEVFFIAETRCEPVSHDYQVFDKVLEISLPNTINREKLLNHYAQKMKMPFEEKSFATILDKTKGITAPQLQKIVNDAATRAVIEQSKVVTQQHLEDAVESISPDKQKTEESEGGLSYFL